VTGSRQIPASFDADTVYAPTVNTSSRILQTRAFFTDAINRGLPTFKPAAPRPSPASFAASSGDSSGYQVEQSNGIYARDSVRRVDTLSKLTWLHRLQAQCFGW
jgi:hypothetical protein